jgi:hypothetical protein
MQEIIWTIAAEVVLDLIGFSPFVALIAGHSMTLRNRRLTALAGIDAIVHAEMTRARSRQRLCKR